MNKKASYDCSHPISDQSRYLLHPTPKPGRCLIPVTEPLLDFWSQIPVQVSFCSQSPSLGPCFSESKLATGLQTFFFQPCHVACGILVPQQEIEPRPLQSKCQVLTQSLLKFLCIESVMLPSHLILNQCELFLPLRINSSMLNSPNFLCKSRYPLLHCCCLSLASWALVEVS